MSHKLEPEPTVVINSSNSEIVLMNILKILNETETKINDYLQFQQIWKKYFSNL